jgi:hypothetical protein
VSAPLVVSRAGDSELDELDEALGILGPVANDAGETPGSAPPYPGPSQGPVLPHPGRALVTPHAGGPQISALAVL